MISAKFNLEALKMRSLWSWAFLVCSLLAPAALADDAAGDLDQYTLEDGWFHLNPEEISIPFGSTIPIDYGSIGLTEDSEDGTSEDDQGDIYGGDEDEEAEDGESGCDDCEDAGEDFSEDYEEADGDYPEDYEDADEGDYSHEDGGDPLTGDEDPDNCTPNSWGDEDFCHDSSAVGNVFDDASPDDEAEGYVVFYSTMVQTGDGDDEEASLTTAASSEEDDEVDDESDEEEDGDDESQDLDPPALEPLTDADAGDEIWGRALTLAGESIRTGACGAADAVKNIAASQKGRKAEKAPEGG